MKNLVVVTVLLSCFFTTRAQTLITYGNNKISKAEFLKAYNKNKTVVEDRAKSIREYVELYTNFKLKVKAANELRYDTLSQIQFDLNNYRTQIQESYLSDQKGIDKLVNEAIERHGKDIHVQHFYIKVYEATDTMKAFMAAREIADELKKGNTGYSNLAQTVSAKYTPVTQRDIGFVTAFTLPYQYENIFYNTAPGEVSAPYRSKDAWHVFKVLETRPNPGNWKVAQMLFAFPPDATGEMKNAVAAKANEVYGMLLKGQDFGELAKQYSNDKLTYTAGGEMPEFSTGKYAYDFEKEIFKLKKEGEYSKPFETAYGYHIVKLIKHTPVTYTASDANIAFEVRQQVMQDQRINIEREKFANNLLKILNYKKTNLVKDADLFRYADSVLKNPDPATIKNYPISKNAVISFNNKPVNGSDWLTYVSNTKIAPEQYNGESAQQLWEKFIRNAAVSEYKKNLEVYNEDFKYQVEEFREGNMLFEIMEKKVWNRAFTDTVGLQNIYKLNKPKYIWDKSAGVIMVNAGTATIAGEIMQALKAGSSFSAVMEKYSTSAQGDSGRFELSQVPGIENLTQPGSYSEIITNTDGSAYFVKLISFYAAGDQRSFDDARGMVINDYQNELEKKWVAELRKKYPVTINEVVLKEIIQ